MLTILPKVKVVALKSKLLKVSKKGVNFVKTLLISRMSIRTRPYKSVYNFLSKEIVKALTLIEKPINSRLSYLISRTNINPLLDSKIEAVLA